MEEWRSIPGYEGLYEASNLGRIRTAAGKTTSNARYEKRVWKQRVLKAKNCKRGHTQKRVQLVNLWKNGVCNTQLVHRMVALAWCDGYADGLTVNHIDGDTLNNKPENLEWISLADNIRHGYRAGLFTNAKPCTLINSKGEPRRFYSLSAAAKSIGRCTGYIRACIKGNRPIRAVSGEIYEVA